MFLRIFVFQEPSGRKTDLVFLVHHFFKETHQMSRRNQREMSRGGKDDPPHGPTTWLCVGAHLPPRGPFYLFLGLYGCVLT
jgi:hypothetical protein